MSFLDKPVTSWSSLAGLKQFLDLMDQFRLPLAQFDDEGPCLRQGTAQSIAHDRSPLNRGVEPLATVLGKNCLCKVPHLSLAQLLDGQVGQLALLEDRPQRSKQEGPRLA